MAEEDSKNYSVKKRHQMIPLSQVKEQPKESREIETIWREEKRNPPLESHLPIPESNPDLVHGSCFSYSKDTRSLHAEPLEQDREAMDVESPSEEGSSHGQRVEDTAVTLRPAFASLRKANLGFNPSPPETRRPAGLIQRRAVKPRKLPLPEKLELEIQSPNEQQFPNDFYERPRILGRFSRTISMNDLTKKPLAGQRKASSFRSPERFKPISQLQNGEHHARHDPSTRKNRPVARDVSRWPPLSVGRKEACEDDLLSLFLPTNFPKKIHKNLLMKRPKCSEKEKARAKGNKFYLPPLPASPLLVTQGPCLHRRSRSDPRNVHSPKYRKGRFFPGTPLPTDKKKGFFATEPGVDEEMGCTRTQTQFLTPLEKGKHCYNTLATKLARQELSRASLARQYSAPSTMQNSNDNLK